MGICSDDMFEKEVNHVVLHEEIKHGRGNVKEVPMELRKVIASTAIEGHVSGKLIAHTFGISESSVSAYKNGSTSTATYNEPDVELKKSVTNKKEQISDIAQSRLIDAINSITREDLNRIKVGERAKVALAMSSVVKNMVEEDRSNDSGVKVMIYAPRIKAEDAYEVIAVNE